MLSPEAELREIVRSVQEPRVSAHGDYLHLREVRALLARTIRATLDIRNVSEHIAGDTIRLALLDLDRQSGV